MKRRFVDKVTDYLAYLAALCYLLAVIAIIIGFITTLTSCGVDATITRENMASMHGLRYYKDHNTNLCFAGTSLSNPAGVLTNVPCTQKVEELILEEEHKVAPTK